MAAEASECAADQDSFWEYHDLLFESQGGENVGAFSNENLKAFAADLGLDQEVFAECLDSGKYRDVIEAQTNAAQQLGVRSTPSFVVNGQPVIGAQSFATFQSLVEKDLGSQ